MKIITGKEAPDQGEVEIGDTIRIGYFAQEVTEMDAGQRVIDYIKDVAEVCPDKRRKDHGVTDAGAVFIYTGNAVYADRKAVRRREKETVSSESTDGGAECADPRRAYQRFGYPDTDDP